MADPSEKHYDLYIVLGRGQDDPERAFAAIGFATAAQAKGLQVELHLMFDGGLLGVEGRADAITGPPPYEGTLGDKLDQFISLGGEVTICTMCLRVRHADDLPLRNGTHKTTLPVVQAKMLSAGKTLQFGC